MPEPGGRRHGAAVAGLVFLALAAMAALAAPWIAPYDPNEQLDPAAGKLRPPLTRLVAVALDGDRWRLAERVSVEGDRLVIESRGRRDSVPLGAVRNRLGDGVRDERIFWLGSDRFGRDVLSRLLHGARVTFLIAGLAIVLVMTIGIAVGALAALGPRIVDAFLMRAVDGLLAFPWLFFLIALAALFPDRGVATLVVLIGASGWMGTSRLVRAELRSLREQDFVLAARALGASPPRIFFHHLLPHVATPLLVQATLALASVISVEASLSFLGLGIPRPRPSWGGMINEGRSLLLDAWWISTPPAMALVATVLALAVASDGLRDWLDPRGP